MHVVCLLTGAHARGRDLMVFRETTAPAESKFGIFVQVLHLGTGMNVIPCHKLRCHSPAVRRCRSGLVLARLIVDAACGPQVQVI